MGQKRKWKELYDILNEVKRWRSKMAGLRTEQFAQHTEEFKKRLRRGETLDELLPEAFALVCEADWRVLKKFPYDVQILGAIAVHQGNLIEMNTGEGKTLMATMPLYLNALTGKSTMLLTTNEYLALRDAEEMGQVYRFLGLTVAAGVSVHKDERMSNRQKQAIYGADILYTTHSALGFDYLFNNLVTFAEERFLRELYYVIIDEADSVLLDAAQMPLIISGAPRVQSNLYELADFFVTTLAEGVDYEVEEQKVWLTERGISYAEQFFRIDNFYGEAHFEVNRHVTLALRAHMIFQAERDYMVAANGALQLLDGGSGRMLPGVKLRSGQHQALEMKEKLKVSQENRSVAAITYPKLFQLFEKMAGMSGTISDAREELQDVYGLDVLVIPPNRPMRRRDLPDVYFKTREEQFEEAFQLIVQTHQTGQPVLIVVSTIAETELISKLLVEEEIPHSVLNANNAFWEAEIIRESGQRDAVTVATGMAGRGTDIKLGDGVAELGGLAVIGIGRMANIRQERQARGRAGRQGDPGFSQFFVSLQDEVVKQNAMLDCQQYVDGKKWISRRKLRRVVDCAQRTGEEFAVLSRKQALDYDKVMQCQRDLVYAARNRLLDGGTLDRTRILRVAEENIRVFLREQEQLDMRSLNRYILDNLSDRLDGEGKKVSLSDEQAVESYLMRVVSQRLSEQERRLGERQMQDFVRIATLSAIDEAWVEEVDYLQQLQSAVAGRSSAQRKPVHEYQKDALEAFQKMERSVKNEMLRKILLSSVSVKAHAADGQADELDILFP